MATWTYADGEAKRKDFMVFWITDGSTTNIAKDKLEIIGKGVEDMPISMNPETEESQDVLCASTLSSVAISTFFTQPS